jgi:hypothetical protein
MVELINRIGGSISPEESLQRAAEKSLGWPVEEIDLKVAELKIQMTNLMAFGD